MKKAEGFTNNLSCFLTRNFIPVLIFLFLNLSAVAQDKWVNQGQLNFGCQLFLTNPMKRQSFPGLRVYVGFSAQATRGSLLLSYGPSLSIYTKTIGANLNPVVEDWQIDFTNTLSVGAVWGGQLTYNKYMRTMHNGDYYNLAINSRNAVVVSTNFIFNNHRRNQVLGSFNINFNKFSLNYYNDGGPPFDWIPITDKFDRYWTGGVAIFMHNTRGYNDAEFGFDQFTGYKPLLYEISNLLGIKVPLYDGPIRDEKSRHPSNYNTAAYHLRINFDQHVGVNIGVNGSLVSKKTGKFWGLQDIIHHTIKNSVHPNNDDNRLFIGGSYNNFQHVKL